MNFFTGIQYNLRGLRLAMRTPKLLVLGLTRFVVVILITLAVSGLILYYHQGIMGLLWQRPDSVWIIWLWHLLSWIVALILVGLAAVLSYLVAQILFSVFIMDMMSRTTEFKVGGQVKVSKRVPIFSQFLYLLGQEIPRTVLPVLASLLVMVLGWFIPLGPILVVMSSGLVILFLAWDNTDLVPARRMVPFRRRLGFLLRRIPFHLGFGLLFLVPGLNILFLSFAPVGGTLYYLDGYDAVDPNTDKQTGLRNQQNE